MTQPNLFVASFSQQSLWLLNQFDPVSSAYNLQVGLRLRGPVNCDALKFSLQEIVNRHDVIRTKFALEEAQLFQIVVPNCVVSLPFADLSSLEDYQSARQETQRSFDLSQAPLFRFTLVRLASDDHVLNWVRTTLT
jgi:Condensation domain